MIVPEITEVDIDQLLIERNKMISNKNEHWKFDEARRHALNSWSDVKACPGSGKTTLVAAKLLLLGQKWKDPNRGMCALTHTNVARDEILAKLQQHPAGFKLSAYPHFIGTIQEFVNRFLGMPYVRSRYEFKRLIENDEGQIEVRRARMDGYTIENICQNLYHTCQRADYEMIKNYLGTLHFVNGRFDLRFFKQHGSQENISSSSNTERRRMLLALKEAMCQAGVFHFKDMYAFGEKLIGENTEFISALRKRFPVVLLDEMQDTQKFQDELLRQIFSCEQVRLQCFGDADQAIFDGIGGEVPNETYNSKSDLHEVNTSFRFGTDIGEKIIGLSYGGLDRIASGRTPERGQFQHTIFRYNDDSQGRVLEEFATLIAQADPNKIWRVIKAIGGVDGESGQIRKYWPQFDKKRTSSHPRPERLIQNVNLVSGIKSGHLSFAFELLNQAVIDLLRKASVKTQNPKGEDVYFSLLSLNRWLRERKKYDCFRKLLTSWILKGVSSSEDWGEEVQRLTDLLEVNTLNEEATEFLRFDDGVDCGRENQVPHGNIYKASNGREIEVGTIHSIKGQTHDATLIMETKFQRWFDCQEMLPYIFDTTKTRPSFDSNSPNSKDSILTQYMRKLYVAGSRPRHLLCMAINNSHVSQEQYNSLRDLGWSFVDLN